MYTIRLVASTVVIIIIILIASVLINDIDYMCMYIYIIKGENQQLCGYSRDYHLRLLFRMACVLVKGAEERSSIGRRKVNEESISDLGNVRDLLNPRHGDLGIGSLVGNVGLIDLQVAGRLWCKEQVTMRFSTAFEVHLK